MASVDLIKELAEQRAKMNREAEQVLAEARKILNEEAFKGKNILHNLKSYHKLNELLNEEELDAGMIYSTEQIREIALRYRLRFVGSQCYRFEFPYETALRIEHLNKIQQKNLKGFKILTTTQFFKEENCKDMALLFAPTEHGQWYLVHQWGKPLPACRKYLKWPLKNIETLFVSLIVFTLIVTLCLPTYLITLDRKATYWCGYRAGVFFHLLIFFMGFTTYFTFAFSRSLGTMIWNKENDL